MIRKAQLLFLLILITITLIKADPYKPKPILFVHGIDGDSKAWGVKPMYKDTVAEFISGSQGMLNQYYENRSNNESKRRRYEKKIKW